MFAENRQTKMLTLFAMCFALFMAMLDNTVVNVALPRIQESLGAGVSGLQWVVDAYTLVFASLLLTGGTLGDLYGRKRLFMAGLIIFSLGSLLCGLSSSIGFLIASRALQGVGAAALIPSTLSIITHTFPDPRERAQAIGLWAGVSGLALALGPVVGGLLVDSLGWQSVFFLNVPVGIAGMIVAARYAPESKNPEGRTLDIRGQLLAHRVARLADVRPDRGERARVDLAAHRVGVRDRAGGARCSSCWWSGAARARCCSSASSATRRSPAASPSPRWCRSACSGCCSSSACSCRTCRATRRSGRACGSCRRPSPSSSPRRSPAAGPARIGSRIPMTIGLAMVGVGMLLYLGVNEFTPYLHWFWIQPIQGVGMGLTMAPMTAAVMGSVPPARSGMASATTNASREVGGTFGIALLGAILTARLNSVMTGVADRAWASPSAVQSKIEFAHEPRGRQRRREVAPERHRRDRARGRVQARLRGRHARRDAGRGRRAAVRVGSSRSSS